MLSIQKVLSELDWDQERLDREQARADLIESIRNSEPPIDDREWCDRRDYYQDSWEDRI